MHLGTERHTFDLRTSSILWFFFFYFFFTLINLFFVSKEEEKQPGTYVKFHVPIKKYIFPHPDKPETVSWEAFDKI